jgi:hypothetical protein
MRPTIAPSIAKSGTIGPGLLWVVQCGSYNSDYRDESAYQRSAKYEFECKHVV